MKLSLVPIFVSLFVHAMLGGVFLYAWPSNSEPKKISQPRHIEAKLVKLTAESKTVGAKKKPKKVDLTKRKKASKPKKASATKAAPKPKVAPKKVVDTKKEDLLKAEAEAQEKQKEREQRLAQLEEDLKSERLTSADTESENEAISYKQVIFNKVRDNWSRPPSARTGMKCELLIEIVPTGRVIGVTVVKSSGNSAFDRSAQQAVYKAESFPELQNMTPLTFERYYRRFNLIFNPQDLRQ